MSIVYEHLRSLAGWLGVNLQGPTMSLLIGADLGGTKLSAVVCGPDGRVVHRAWQPHAAGDYPSVLGTINDVVAGCLEFAASMGQQVVGVGLSIAGWMSRDRTELLWGANIGSRGATVKADLESMLGLPVAIENDGNATALAEHRRGGGQQVRALALLTLGTGMGGGMVLDGQLVIGGSGLAGELGHVPVLDSNIVCICGGVSCVELFTSGRGLVQQYNLAAAAVSPAVVPLVRSADIVAAATAGEPVAVAVLHRAAMALARIVQMLIPTVDPDLVLIGGTVGHAAGPLLLATLTAEVQRQRPLRAVKPAVRIALADLGPEAAALGAVEIIRDQLNHPIHPARPDVLELEENPR